MARTERVLRQLAQKMQPRAFALQKAGEKRKGRRDYDAAWGCDLEPDYAGLRRGFADLGELERQVTLYERGAPPPASALRRLTIEGTSGPVNRQAQVALAKPPVGGQVELPLRSVLAQHFLRGAREAVCAHLMWFRGERLFVEFCGQRVEIVV
eukprot:gene3876-316_t